MTSAAASFTPTRSSGGVLRRPPGWLFAATGVLGLGILVMAVAETNLWVHYLIDGGEYVSLGGLAFIAAASIVLYRRHALTPSLPLVGPWLLFPLITQGDQIIDNLSITTMRVVCHVLLAAIFGTPVAVAVAAAGHALTGRSRVASSPLLGILPGLRPLAEGRNREGVTLLATALLVLEMWVAVEYLGTLMVATLIVMTFGVLWWGSMSSPTEGKAVSARRTRSERFALVLVLAGVVVSLALYVGYKNRPGAYQGSPSFLMDPSQQGSGYALDRVPVPAGAVTAPASPEAIEGAFSGFGRSLQRLMEGYHILDRNYTWDFHNELFMRSTTLVPNYRSVGLAKIAEARQMRDDADALARTARAVLSGGDPLAALLDDVTGYVAFTFDRAARIEVMSADFEKTKAGLQHAAHIYEGEGKVLGMVLVDILNKHQRTLDSPPVAPLTRQFASDSRTIYATYADSVVGF